MRRNQDPLIGPLKNLLMMLQRWLSIEDNHIVISNVSFNFPAIL